MVNGAIEAKVCWTSHGQPLMGSRSDAMISIRRRMSLEGCMGKANSLEVGEKDYWTAERSAARRSLFMMGNGLKRERNGFAAFGRIHHSHRDLLAFGQMRNAGRTE